MNLPDFNSADLNEIRRLLQSIVRTGKVSMVDTAVTPPCVRVESGSLHTDWIPWTTSRAAGVSHWRPPFVGEDVLLLAIGGDTGNARVIGSLYTEDNPPPERSLDKTVTVYPDGARIEYDHASSTLTATLPGQAIVTTTGAITVTSDADITAKAPTINAAASVSATVKAPVIAATADTSITLKAPAITLDGHVTVTQGVTSAVDVTAGGISLMSHQHPSVQRGSAKTDPPE
ncbi:phage baseplate assembly protein V [Zymobacter sp. IVIA_5232.4 C2]|uniref:phage baseplate assembly protein V n=1 Tax=Zymobacter sp. IVIA_5232.4 C2 TaxID=3394855 RepID=UPI0039C48D37